MADRLKDKVAIVVGAGQPPGDTIGNGRAISILFAREGASLVLADRNMESAKETQTMIDGPQLAGPFLDEHMAALAVRIVHQQVKMLKDVA